MTLTIEISEADAPRVCAAFGSAETPATAEQLTATVKHYLGQSTLEWEKAQAMADYESPPLGLMA